MLVYWLVLLGVVKMYKLESDENLSFCGDILKEVIERDKNDGFILFFVRLCLNIYFLNFLIIYMYKLNKVFVEF